MKIPLPILGFLPAILLAVSAQAQSRPPERDFQSWNDFQVRIPVSRQPGKRTPKVSVMLYGTLRLGRNLEAFVDERIGFGLEFRARPFLTVTPSFVIREAQPWPGRKESERRVRFDIGLEKSAKGFLLRDRNRVEYRMRSGTENSFRYRNRLQVSRTLKRNGKEAVSPFLANEVFYDLTQGRFTRNEISIGMAKKLSAAVAVEAYYTYQRNRSTSFKVVNVFGLGWRFDVP